MTVMRAQEFVTESTVPGFDVFQARVRVRNPGYTSSIEVVVFARNAQMARAQLQAQYGDDSVVTGITKVS